MPFCLTVVAHLLILFILETEQNVTYRRVVPHSIFVLKGCVKRRIWLKFFHQNIHNKKFDEMSLKSP